MNELPTEEERAAEDVWQQFKLALGRELHADDPRLTDAEALAHCRKLALAVAANFQSPVSRRLEEDAISHLYEHLHQFNPDIGKPTRWFRAVVRNLGCDVYADAGTECRAGIPVEELETPDREPPPEPGCSEQLRSHLRQGLELLREPEVALQLMPEGADAVDYYLVFTIEYRLRVAERLESGEAGLQQVNQWLPWEPWETFRRVKKTWPGLVAMWEHLSPSPARSRQDWLDQLFVWCNGQIQVAREKAVLEKWNKWVQRAKEAIRDGKRGMESPILTANWMSFFERLFPDYETRSGEQA